MNREEYRNAASAHRARLRKASAICMAYESRPRNADEVAEREAMHAALNLLPDAPAPAGMDRAVDLLTRCRMRHAAIKNRLLAMREDQQEVIRRADEAICYWQIGIDAPVYHRPTTRLCQSVVDARADIRNMIKRWP